MNRILAAVARSVSPLVLCLAVPAALVPPAPALAQAEPAPIVAPKQGQITAAGTARVYRSPDHLTVTVGVFRDAAEAGAAQEQAGAAMAKVVAAVKKLELSGAEFQTTAVRLDARYGRDRDGESGGIIGYRGEMSLTIRTGDLKAAARIIDAAMKSGANRVGGVEFGIKEAIAAREEALKLAMQAAKRKAAVMAEGLEVRLGHVVNAGEESQRYGSRMSQMTSNFAREGGEGGSAAEGAFEAGKVEVWAEVSVTFAVEPLGRR
jgi:hypothetical protein